jgi:diphthamide synthase subunit DPH2
MKIYVAASFQLKERVKELYNTLQERGHEITVDWTAHKPVEPFDQNEALSREYSVEDIEGVADSDVFILLSDVHGKGMYVELGAAIISHLRHGKPIIYVVGERNAEVMFYFHPSVNRRETIEDILDEIDEF